ncbi:MAG TPA: aldehyde dehydrogenase family protein [Nocardioides sp.]|nr:aldehyde dehydrogenase family protein [Nocardioides sp.]
MTTPDFTTDLLLGDSFVAGTGGTLTSLNPTTGAPLADISAASAADVDRAVAAATSALRGDWAAVPPSGKATLIHRLADLVERDASVLADLDSLDMGVPNGLAQMLFVPNLVATLRYYAGWADKINGEQISNDGYLGRPTHAYTLRQPVGVIAAIVPWNAPLMILGWKLAPALACGNTVIIKPAEDASLSILHLARLVVEAGFPAGVVQVLPGEGAVTGAALVRHRGVHKVSFTGSTEVGREIQKVGADTFKRTTLELGGKSAQIVCADADLDVVLPSIGMGVFANSGQTCAAGSRVFVHRTLYDAVLDGLGGAASSQVLGDPFAAETTLGPLVSETQRDRVLGYVRKGSSEGAKLVAGGRAFGDAGFFVEPTVFAGTNEMTIAREEIFGPVATVIPFESDEEALAMANDTDYGLAGTIYTQDLARAHTMSAGLQAGAVAINGWSPLMPQLPWGGLKSSGVGRECGYDGILANTESKTVTVVL